MASLCSQVTKAKVLQATITMLSELETALCCINMADHGSVIFVHGLRGHPRDTWSTKPPASSPDCDNSIIKQKNFKNFFGLKTSRGKAHHEAHIPARIFWPEAYLAHDLPDARIWTYGYNADVIGGVFQSNNKNSISQHGRDLAVKLEREIDNQVSSHSRPFARKISDSHLYRIRSYLSCIVSVGLSQRT